MESTLSHLWIFSFHFTLFQKITLLSASLLSPWPEENKFFLSPYCSATKSFISACPLASPGTIWWNEQMEWWQLGTGTAGGRPVLSMEILVHLGLVKLCSILIFLNFFSFFFLLFIWVFMFHSLVGAPRLNQTPKCESSFKAPSFARFTQCSLLIQLCAWFVNYCRAPDSSIMRNLCSPGDDFTQIDDSCVHQRAAASKTRLILMASHPPQSIFWEINTQYLV